MANEFTHQSHAAYKRIKPYIRETPLERSSALSEICDAEVYVKLENYQITGSFKLRGALNKLLTLTPEQKKKGVLAASTGNHGAGVGKGMSLFGIEGTIFIPTNALPAKVAALRRNGTPVKIAGGTCEMAESLARAAAQITGATFISPYNDAEVVAGQGTIGIEIRQQLLKSPDAIFVSVGGGGLIAGISEVLKSEFPMMRAFGCSPINDSAMASSVKAGKIISVDAKPTISDGTAGGVEPGSLTFERCQRLIDQFVLVEEFEIKSALRWLIDVPHVLVEGAAAVALAGLLKVKEQIKGKTVVVVLCGSNIGTDTLRELLG